MNSVSETLNGVDMEAKITERMNLFEEKFAMKRTEEKLQETEKKLEQAELYIDILEDKLEESKAKPNHIGAFDLAKLASSTIEGIAVHYPKVLDKVPVLNGIAKVIQEENRNKPAQLNGGFDGDVSFKTKSTKSSEATEHDESIKLLKEFIEEHFDPDQKQILGAVILALGENPSQVTTVAELLNIDLKALNEEE